MPYKFIIESEFNFGDIVQYVSSHGVRKGSILDIVLMPDKSIYYIIEDADGQINGGIMPNEVKLFQQE